MRPLIDDAGIFEGEKRTLIDDAGIFKEKKPTLIDDAGIYSNYPGGKAQVEHQLKKGEEVYFSQKQYRPTQYLKALLALPGYSAYRAGKLVYGIGKEIVDLGRRLPEIEKGAVLEPEKYALETLELAAFGITKAPSAIKQLKPTIKPVKKSIKVSEVAPESKIVEEGIAEVKPGNIPPKTKTLRIQEQEEIITKSIEKAIAHPDDPIILDEATRAFKKVAHLIDTEQISAGSLQEIVARYNWTPRELAQEVIWAGSHAGKTLNQFSQFSKALTKAFPKDEAVQGLLSKAAKRPRSAYEWFADTYRWADNKRRMMMVSQVATSARNALSQAGRYGINIFDDAILGTMKLGKGESPSKAYAELMGDFAGMWGRLSPARRKTLEGILDKFPMEKARMFSAPIHDITMGDKIGRTVMALNRGQEYFFRRMAADSKLRGLAKRAGIKMEDVTEDMLAEAVTHAQELTFAAPPTSAPGKAIMELYKKVPFLTTVQPYPRFWMNSLKFLWDFNPTGFASVAGHLANKNPELAMRAASKAMVGTLMLGSAFAARTSKYAGERYYEWKKWDTETDKQAVDKDGNALYYDLRAFAPYTSYLFVAEQVMHPERIRPYDRVQALVGINRIGGTGLILFDVLRNKSSDSVKNQLKEFGGQWLGGFTVPLRSIKDFWAGIEKEEAQVQATQESPLLGPAISNLPGSQRILPPAPRLTRGEPYKREETVKRQLTGLTVKTKTPLEQEIDRIGTENLWPRTGDAKLNRLIIEKAGKRIEREGGNLIKTNLYKQADDLTKESLIKLVVNDIKDESRKKVFVPHIEERVSKLKSKTAKKEYIEKLIKQKKLSQSNFILFAERNSRLFSLNDWGELISLMESPLKRIGNR